MNTKDKEKRSFLSDIIGSNNYNKITETWKWPIAIYSVSALVLYGLTTICYSQVVSYLFSLLVGFNLFFIVFLFGLTVCLDIQVSGKGFEKRDGAKPSFMYICTILWLVILLFVGVFAIWKTEKMRKDYAFQCKTVYVDQANKILHLYDFCESIDWDHVEKVKVHTINHNNYSRCEECIEWTYEMHDAARDLYLRHE